MTPWRQTLLITGAALGVFLLLRSLPTGTNLSHMDFRVEGRGALEWCDPANPQFVPVLQVRSPVIFAIVGETPLRAGVEGELRLELRTASGKVIVPADLATVHTRKLHVLAIDSGLADYQHLHPEPSGRAGEWRVRYTPRLGGEYRLFADFTPVATGRSLYAVAEVRVEGGLAGDELRAAMGPTGAAGVLSAAGQERSVVLGEHELFLRSEGDWRAGRSLTLRFAVRDRSGRSAVFTPVMGAEAHLVAFDSGVTGFAHLHPIDPTNPETAKSVSASFPAGDLVFNLTLPRPGRYAIWSQCAVAGREMFARFWVEVPR